MSCDDACLVQIFIATAILLNSHGRAPLSDLVLDALGELFEKGNDGRSENFERLEADLEEYGSS